LEQLEEEKVANATRAIEAAAKKAKEANMTSSNVSKPQNITIAQKKPEPVKKVEAIKKPEVSKAPDEVNEADVSDEDISSLMS
jgi:hypothetical protein